MIMIIVIFKISPLLTLLCLFLLYIQLILLNGISILSLYLKVFCIFQLSTPKKDIYLY